MELAAGILILILSILHIVYGEMQPVANVSKVTDDRTLIGSVRVMSLQGGILLFAVGMIHIMQFFDVISLSGAAAYFPLGVILINLFTFLLVAVWKHRELFSVAVFKLVVFAVIIILQILSLL